MVMIFLTQLSDWQSSNLNVFGRVSRMRDAEEKQCLLCLCESIGNDRERDTRDTRRDEPRRERERREERKAKEESVRFRSAV